MQTHSCVSTGLHMHVWYAGADNAHQVWGKIELLEEGPGCRQDCLDQSLP